MGDPQFICRALTQGTTASVRVIPEHRIRTRIDVRVTFANAGPRQALSRATLACGARESLLACYAWQVAKAAAPSFSAECSTSVSWP
jgi:hypothetical protein